MTGEQYLNTLAWLNMKKTDIMDKSKVIGATLIMAGLMSMGWFIKSGIDNFSNKDRYVTVKGLAEREVQADRVVWNLPYKCVSNDLTQLYKEVESNSTTIITFLKNNGIHANEILVSAPQVRDREADYYSSNDIKYRYQAETVVTVISSQVDKILSLMQKQVELMKMNIAITTDYQYQTTFEFTKLNELKPTMIEEATRNARAVAQKFAEDSQSTLGDIRKANQGQFSITSDDFTPQIKRVRVVTTIDYALK